MIIGFQMLKQEKSKCEILLEDLESSNRRNKKIKEKFEEKKQDYKEILKEHEEIKNNLAINFYTLSENLANYAKFNLIDIDDAVQEGVMICFEKIDKFDKNKGKAFNYMTTCIFNHFRQLYRTARNYNEFKKKLHDFLQSRGENVKSKKGSDGFSTYNKNN